VIQLLLLAWNESTIPAVSLVLPPVALASHVIRASGHRRNSVTALKGGN